METAVGKPSADTNARRVARITTIPILGEQIVAPLLALGPPLLIVGPIFEWSETRATMLAFWVLSVPWLLWLQWKAGIVITCPLFEFRCSTSRPCGF